MQFKLRATPRLPIDPQLTWIFFSKERNGFIVGDDKQSFALPLHQPDAPSSQPAEPASTANLPIAQAMYDEFRRQSWHGFQFLDRDRAPKARDGDLVRLLVFGPNYGDCVLHPATGAILALRGGSISLLDNDLKPIEKTKTRGRAALAFAAHPTEGVIAYGDNFGTFHAQRFDAVAFGKASKIIAKDRKASRLEFVKEGSILVIGGMGYLQTLSYADGNFTPLHETSVAVRDFLWLNDGALVLVNQGMHGIAALRYDENGFSKLADLKPGSTVQQIAASTDAKYIAITDQESPVVSIYELSM
jgi:hypothetical protein